MASEGGCCQVIGGCGWAKRCVNAVFIQVGSPTCGCVMFVCLGWLRGGGRGC